MKRLFLSLVILLTPILVSAQTDSANALYQKGTATLAEGNFKEAKSTFESALNQASEKQLKASIFLGIGVAEYNLKQFKSADKTLKKSAKIRDGKHAETLYYQGLTRVALEDEASAMRLFNLAIATDSKHGESWYELAQLLLKKGNKSRAKIAFEMALKNGTSHEKEAKSRLAQLNGGNQYDKES